MKEWTGSLIRPNPPSCHGCFEGLCSSPLSSGSLVKIRTCRRGRTATDPWRSGGHPWTGPCATRSLQRGGGGGFVRLIKKGAPTGFPPRFPRRDGLPVPRLPDETSDTSPGQLGACPECVACMRCLSVPPLGHPHVRARTTTLDRAEFTRRVVCWRTVWTRPFEAATMEAMIQGRSSWNGRREESRPGKTTCKILFQFRLPPFSHSLHNSDTEVDIFSCCVPFKSSSSGSTRPVAAHLWRGGRPRPQRVSVTGTFKFFGQRKRGPFFAARPPQLAPRRAPLPHPRPYPSSRPSR